MTELAKKPTALSSLLQQEKVANLVGMKEMFEIVKRLFMRTKSLSLQDICDLEKILIMRESIIIERKHDESGLERYIKEGDDCG